MKNLIKYFCHLLILQYRNKPKARATIEALVKILFGDDAEGIIALDVEEGYSLDNASSAQLDVLGKYIGYSSDVNIIVDNNFKYAEYDDSVNPDTGYSEYNDSVSSLPYAEYRYVTYLKQILNYTDYTKVLNFLAESKGKVLSLGELDSLLNKYFDGNIYVIESDKEVEYHFLQEFLIDFDTDDKLQVFTDKYLPKPMGCSVMAVRDPYYLKIESVNGATMDENYIFTNNQANIDPRTYPDTVKYFKTKEPIDLRNHNKDIEFRMKFKATASYSGLWCADKNEISWNWFFSGYVSGSKQLWVSINANFYNAPTIELDTWYWVKMTHVANSNTWTVEYSTDGTNYIFIYEYGYMLSIPAMYMWLGAGASTASTYGFSGSIDFKETDIIIDGKSVLWTKYRV